MPTIKHTNKTGETCSQLRFTSAAVVPLHPPPLYQASPFNPFAVGSSQSASVAFSLELAANLLFILLSLAIWLLLQPPSPYSPAGPSATPFVYGVWRKRLKQNLFSRPRGNRTTTTEQQQNPRDSQCDKNASENKAKRMLNQKQQTKLKIKLNRPRENLV